MSKLIGIMGNSGVGKSQCFFPSEALGIVGLDPAQTFFININKKAVGVAGFAKIYKAGENTNSKQIDNIATLSALVERVIAKGFKNIIIDDFGYMINYEYIDYKNAMSGMKNKFDKMDAASKGLVEFITSLSFYDDDVTIFITFHTDELNGKMRVKTPSEHFRKQFDIDGIFSTLLLAEKVADGPDAVKHVIYTGKNMTTSTCKSLPGSFPEGEIPNDAGYILYCIHAYDAGETPQQYSAWKGNKLKK